ncbi:MAG TPA: glycosyltransferase family 4 protein [Edaphocola sp.]|nr:glycosyltransferase family 4 protein [Edaphocola sp.]
MHYRIIDKPNDRSSHRSFTIRGAGIIFLVAIIIAWGFHFPQDTLPTLAALLIGGISFVDDRISLSRRLRILVQFLAVSVLFYKLHVFEQCPLLAIVPLFVLAVGIINAYNFMDGINGITGLYSLVVLGSLQYVNLYLIHFVFPDLIWFPMLACLVFLYYNFRIKAKCFAGDVGSISMAFWIVFLMLKLVMNGGSWGYILFLSVYGIDSVLTIVHRLLRKENIFEPHRIHLFQLLANEVGWSHLTVTSIYAVVQVIISVLVIGLLPVMPAYLLALVILVPLVVLYLLIKPRLMRLIKCPSPVQATPVSL